MRRLLRFVRLPLGDQCMLVEAVALTAIARLALIVLPFRRIAPWLGRHMAESSATASEDRQATLNRIQKSIRVASRHVPWRSQCLAQAISGTIMLRRRGIDGTVYLGVAKEGQLETLAHAWLRSGSTIVTGAEGLERLSVISTFAFPASKGLGANLEIRKPEHEGNTKSEKPISP